MDLDGTLLKSDKSISLITKNKLLKYKDDNFIIVAVTARCLDSVFNVIKDDIFNYIIYNNGAGIYDVSLKKDIYNKNISLDIVKQIINDLTDYSDIDIITRKCYLKYKSKLSYDYSFIKSISSLDDIKDDVARINIFYKSLDKLLVDYNLLTDKYKMINVFLMQEAFSDKWIVINPFSVSKASSLVYLLKLLKIDISYVIYFGDGLNDLPVMELGLVSVAMKNSVPEVSSLAKFKCDSNDNDGIVKFLDYYIGSDKNGKTSKGNC